MSGKRRAGTSTAILISAALLLLAPKISQAKYSGGTGEPNDPYRIATANDLNDIGNHVEDFNKCFVMVNDINLADYNGTQFKIIGNVSPYFTGVFDGNDHVISNFTYEANDTSDVGLFSYVDGNGLIKDLTLLEPNVAVSGESYSVGTLVGLLDGTVSGCTVVDALVSGYNYVGGLVGRASLLFSPLHGSILNSGFSGAVSGDYCVGGLAGVAGSVVHSYSQGTVSGDSFVGGLIGEVYGKQILWNFSAAAVTGRVIVGGLVGANGPFYGRIIGCYATGSVEGEDYVGGLVGHNMDYLADSYATGSVAGDTRVGGLVGCNGGGTAPATLERCFAAGTVSGTEDVGGLAGYTNKEITYSFWDTDVNPDVNGIGNANDPNVVGKTTAEMQSEGTFTDAGWDFTTPIWIMCDEPNYPKLWWQECFPPSIEVAMKFTPQALNPGSKGNWVKAHFVLPEEYTVSDVDVNSPAKITEPFQPDIDSNYVNVFINDDNLVEVEAAFDRAEFCAAGTDGNAVEVTAAGSLTSGQQFYGTDTVKITNNTFKHLADLTSYWLEESCDQPDWCSGLDLDQDSAVDFIDYALFDGCCIEVVRE